MAFKYSQASTESGKMLSMPQIYYSGYVHPFKNPQYLAFVLFHMVKTHRNRYLNKKDKCKYKLNYTSNLMDIAITLVSVLDTNANIQTVRDVPITRVCSH